VLDEVIGEQVEESIEIAAAEGLETAPREVCRIRTNASDGWS
jgi:hypothetical protein